MALIFQPAQRKKTKLRMAIDGPSGAGKTYTALRFAFALGSKVAVIDTEYGSASKYQGESPDGQPWEFQVVELGYFAPEHYVEAIQLAAQHRFDVLVIDSLSHAWSGKDGALEQVDKVAAKMRTPNNYTAWRDVTPKQNAMIDTIIRAPMHVICTMRSKMDYVIEQDERGKSVIRKVGMAPIQRQGVEYEFDIICDMDIDHKLIVSKSRCSIVADAVVAKPTGAFMLPIKQWLESGAEVSQETIAAAGITYQQPAPTSNGNAPAPVKSLKELAAEKKAAAIAQGKNKNDGDAGGSAGVTANLKPAPGSPSAQAPAMPQSAVDNRQEVRLTDRATQDQVDQIKDCWRELAALGVNGDARDKALAKRGVQTEAQLTVAQATELLANQQGMITRKSMEKRVDQTVGTGAETPVEPTTETPMGN